MSVRLRFAPSPTGYVHIGGLRTALYNYLYAKKEKGQYILRVEDTDQTRLVEGAVEGMIKAMSWAGVMHEEGPMLEDDKIVEIGEYGPYVQSDRLEIYKKHSEELIEKGHAYYCFCSKERMENVREAQKAEGKTAKYDGHCRHLSKEEVEAKLAAGESHVVRLKLPENRVIEFDDLIKGHIAVNTNDMDDQVLMKADGFPTYHLAVVVDDHYMKISHVVRGDEWLISTPKHIYTYEAFGWEVPQFVHLPVILSQSKKKLSKREGDVSVEDFRKKGYLPEALINFIALVGWSPEDGEEIMSIDELIEKFSFDRVSKSSGVFDVDKLNWMNNHYIKQYDLAQLTELCKPYFVTSGFTTEANFEANKPWFEKIVECLRERLNKLDEIESYFGLLNNNHFELEDQEAEEMISMAHVSALLEALKLKFSEIEVLEVANVKATFKALQKELGVKGKNLFMPIRVAMTGQVHGPDIALLIEIIGKDNAVERIEHSLKTFCKS
ncbi:glutamate--tRNA ligase [Fusibacter ferrireducens]|uniref:Glutamate--tRNA ligase n=1 Tax=Fusibacter ferrireducens TaxID=2785058 RepID=A0ABS0A145_9FIRM|nr:glutamate--tRNA ligase [Fusibacter ferrireducens]MBF4695941.1 glutamate--tRNA ligase [Fusibacter ferrireducens]